MHNLSLFAVNKEGGRIRRPGKAGWGMVSAWWIPAALFAGAAIGYMTAALMFAARSAEDEDGGAWR